MKTFKECLDQACEEHKNSKEWKEHGTADMFDAYDRAAEIFEQQFQSPTVTDEEIDKLFHKEHPLTGVVGIDARNNLRKEGFLEGFKAAQSRLSQPVGECKYVWFVENENNEWLVNKKTFTNNPLEAARFSSEEEAVEYIIHSELHDCKPTQHEFVSSQPVTGYSEEEVIEAIKIAYTGGLEKLGWGESRTKAIQSLKSKPNNGTKPG